MALEKKYHALHEDKIFMGGAADVEAMVKNEDIDVVVDLRGEAAEKAYLEGDYRWIPVQLADHAEYSQEEGFTQAIQAVTDAYKENKKVAFHCGGGKGRTGTVAIGTLISLGVCDTIEEAEAKAKSIRSIIDIKPAQRESLHKIYPDK